MNGNNQGFYQQQSPMYGINYQQGVAQQPAQQEYFVGINGESSAFNYPIAPGSTVWLIDASNHKVYVKARDYQGTTLSLREFDLVEKEPIEPMKTSELDDIKQSIELLKNEIKQMMPVINELKS